MPAGSPLQGVDGPLRFAEAPGPERGGGLPLPAAAPQHPMLFLLGELGQSPGEPGLADGGELVPCTSVARTQHG